MAWTMRSLEVFRQTLLALLRTRMIWLVGLVIAGMGALALLLPNEGSSDIRGPELFGILTGRFYFMFMLPFSAMFFGVQAVHGDIEDRTIHYQFLRPVHRSSILVGKWVAVVVMTIVLSVLALVVLHLTLDTAGRQWEDGVGPDPAELWNYGQAVSLASAAYGAVAVLFGAYFNRPMIWAAVFIAGWELFASNLPPEAGVRALTVGDPLRRFLIASLELAPDSQLAEVLWPHEDWRVDEMGSPLQSLFFFTVICLGLGLWVYGRTEYDSRPRE